MRDEYTLADLGEGIRGKYYDAYQKSHNVVRLYPEVAEAFPDEASVNEALMELIRIARRTATAKSEARRKSR
jgi:outer membrane protein assembly factor BamD (BamD/ComL family)